MSGSKDGSLPAGAGAEAPAIDSIAGLLQAGGPVVAILLAMSVAALAIVLVKLWQFHGARLGQLARARAALGLYRAGRAGDASDSLDGGVNPVERILAQAIRGQSRGLPETKVREEVVRAGGDVMEELRGLLRPLEVIAALAPLLGLFGTVLGMIEAFRRLSDAGSKVDPSVLSGGIWEALMTTAVGLAVAIPTVALLNWLEHRVERVAHELDSIVTAVFTEDLSGSGTTRSGTAMDKDRSSHDATRLGPAVLAASGD